MFSIKHKPEDQDFGGGDSQDADEYLSKLAQSILKKDRKPRPPAAPEAPAAGAPPRAGSSSANPRPPSSEFNRPPSSPAAPRPAPQPQAQPAIDNTPQKGTLGAAQLELAKRFPWKREVDYYDEDQHILPGTILVFEDHSMGIFKESNPSKEYDIVYILKQDGRAIPQGMPLYAYEKDPVGRLSAGVLSQLIQNGRWERDMIIFHLLKFIDRKHVPQIDAQAPVPVPASDTFSSWAVKKLSADEINEPEKREQFIRGRKFHIKFGPTQEWDAVYWGKDELGHIVAHDTHNKWTLMHLDLGRFKDSITFGDMADEATLSKIQEDFSAD